MKRSDSYWETRVQRIFDERQRAVRVDKLYRRAYDDMHKEVRALYEELGDRELTRTELYKASRFLSFRSHLQKSLTGISGTLEDSMSSALIKAYKAAGLAAKDSIGAKSVWTVQNRHMAEAAVSRKWAGNNFSGRIWKNRDQLAKTVEKGVCDIVITGRGRNELLRELNNTQYRDRFVAPNDAEQSEIEAQLEAYLQRGRRQAECLVRTEVMHAINTGQIETYRSEGVNYLSFECEPTACPECLEIAEKNPYSIDKIPCPIRHPRCRCTWLAVEDEDVSESVKECDGFKGKLPKSSGVPMEVSAQHDIKPSFIPAKTIEEAQEYARSIGVKYPEFRGWSMERIQNVIDAVETLPADCRPKVIGNGKIVSTVTGRPLGRSANNWYGVTYDYRLFSLRTMQLGYDSTDYDGGLIVGINTTKFRTIASLTKEKERYQAKYIEKYGRKAFFNVDGEATAFHEMGHCYEKVKGIPQGFKEAASRWYDETSCKILENASEAWAEAWAAYHTNKTDLPQYIKVFIEMATQKSTMR